MVVYSENLIPKMTSNTTPSGVVQTSNNRDTTYVGWRAFDKQFDIPNSWATATNVTSAWINYTFTTSKQIQMYSIRSYDQSFSPKSWTFEGSNDGTTWDILDIRNNELIWGTGTSTRRVFTFSNNKSYIRYRLNISGVVGQSYLIIEEIEMFEIINQNKILLSSDDKGRSVKKGMLVDSNVIPAHSSNASPNGGLVNTNNTVPSTAYTLFDGNSSNNLTFGLMTNVWVSYEFPSPKTIAKYTLIVTGASSINRAPREWKFEGSNDGVIWTQLDYQNEPSNNWTMGVKRSFTITNTIKFKFYRVFIILSNNGSSTAPSLSEIEMMEKSPNELYELDTLNENTALNYGSDTSINLTEMFTKAKVIKSTNSTVGSGKIFEHTVDMSKRRVDKIKLG
ncbi:hypothetical protein [Paenibacillus xylanexedens]|uniref:hypothetical protein n=1 Tax=Paenibacillus xylanexedens TaxID=528191 RepID=UPI000F52BEDC|nr:hypothetical protein [Paenibacillus xylanexedens]RPK28779.1 hypothetical protein EDO6_04306 [Paenibacillus xylanexedens]